ncbi:MAG: hypothetical protein QOH90_2316 [Actinomycetota bacterium]|nr:hypothetical protein [Actinomycetota bacterium]
MALHLATKIDIDGPPEAVWAVLSDLPSYPSWNPFIREASGTLTPGERLEIELQPARGRSMRFRPTVLAAKPGRELRWLGRLLVRGLFDGEHRFAIEPTARGSRLVQEERFTGLLVPFLARGLRRGTLPGFERMNEALKRRVEGPTARAAA